MVGMGGRQWEELGVLRFDVAVGGRFVKDKGRRNRLGQGKPQDGDAALTLGEGKGGEGGIGGF